MPVRWVWPSFKVTNASQTWLLFNLQYIGQWYVSYSIQTRRDGRLMNELELYFEIVCKAWPSCSYLFLFFSCLIISMFPYHCIPFCLPDLFVVYHSQIETYLSHKTNINTNINSNNSYLKKRNYIINNSYKHNKQYYYPYVVFIKIIIKIKKNDNSK